MILPASGEPIILIIDNDKSFTELANLMLTGEGYEVEVAFDAIEARERLGELRPNLVVVDITMPGVSGWEFCRLASSEATAPIVVLTVRGEDTDRIDALKLRADDYLVKPINSRELVARINDLLQGDSPVAGRSAVQAIRNVRVDRVSRAVSIDGTLLKLRPKEFDLLSALAASPGAVFSRENLLDQVWGYSFPGNSRTIDVHVNWLRQKLARAEVQIRTVWGIGYKLTPTDE